jgi:hypothetical protein
MLKEQHRKGTHQHRGQFPGQPLRIARLLNLGKRPRQFIPKRVKG